VFKATQQDISSNQIKNTRKKLQYIKLKKMQLGKSTEKWTVHARQIYVTQGQPAVN
jgi:hypothetical protein